MEYRLNGQRKNFISHRQIPNHQITSLSNHQIICMNFIIKLLITAAVAYGLSAILTGVHIDDFKTAIIFALVLAALNAIVKPILIILTLPITILTLGLFLFVINAIIILMASKFTNGIRIDGFFWALIFSFILSVFSSGFNALLKDDKDK
jgi:putative membrane protein